MSKSPVAITSLARRQSRRVSGYLSTAQTARVYRSRTASFRGSRSFSCAEGGRERERWSAEQAPRSVVCDIDRELERLANCTSDIDSSGRRVGLGRFGPDRLRIRSWGDHRGYYIGLVPARRSSWSRAVLGFEGVRRGLILSRKQRHRVDADSVGDPLETPERQVPLATLDRAHVGAMDADDVGERFLAQSPRLAVASKVAAHHPLQLAFHIGNVAPPATSLSTYLYVATLDAERQSCN